MTAPTVTPAAFRTTSKRAAEAFAKGQRVLVSTSTRTLIPVGPSTVTHSRETTTWPELVKVVIAYGDSAQRFYIVQEG